MIIHKWINKFKPGVKFKYIFSPEDTHIAESCPKIEKNSDGSLEASILVNRYKSPLYIQDQYDKLRF